VLRPGDSLLLKRGDTFPGAIEITASGTPSFPIVLSAYGSGPLPVISGLVPLAAWKEVSKGIYKAASPSRLPEMNMLVVNGRQQPMGRYPNTGYLPCQSHALPDWKGAEFVIRKHRWIIDRSRDPPTDGYGFFIQNDPRTLDESGEWYFDRAKKEVYVFFGNHEPPDTYNVKVSRQDHLIRIDHRRFVTFDRLSVEGAGSSAFSISNAEHITIHDCRIDLSAADAIYASGSAYLRIESCFIDHSLNDAINLDMGCPFAEIRNNTIRNTGMLAGMGKSGTGSYQAVSAFGDNSIIGSNTIDSTGYNPIYFGGNATTVKDNRIGYFCCVKDDGAGIYVGDWRVTTQKRIIGNIVFNGIGAPGAAGAPAATRQIDLTPQVEGIYIDDNSSGVDIRSNTISNCPDAGIKIHNAHEVNIQGNTIFNNGIQLLLAEDTFSSHSPVRNIYCTGNILRCKAPGQLCLNIISTADDIDSFATITGNNYFPPPDDDQRRAEHQTPAADQHPAESHTPAGGQKPIQLVSRIWSASSLTKDLTISQWLTQSHSSPQR
jgi:parallel beta-helix repeat protein